MDKKFLSGMMVMLGIVSVLVILMPNSQSQTPPPTDSVKTIYIMNNLTVPNSSENFIDADTYNFVMGLGTDGSININITDFTP